jgi:hypothetical protein
MNDGVEPATQSIRRGPGGQKEFLVGSAEAGGRVLAVAAARANPRMISFLRIVFSLIDEVCGARSGGSAPAPSTQVLSTAPGDL